MSLGVERFLEVHRSLRLLQPLLQVFDGEPLLVEVVLDAPELLDLDEDLLRRRETTGELGRGVVDVSVVRHAAHPDCRVVGAALGDRLGGRDEDVAEDVFESASRSLVVLDEVEGEFSSMLSGGGDATVVGLVDLQRRDGEEDRLGLDRFGLDEGGDGLGVADGDVIESTTGSDLEGSSGGGVRFGKVDEAGESAEDGGAVKPGVGVVGAEVDSRDFATLVLTALWRE